MRDPYATISLTVEEIQQALGDVNRYYCSQALGRADITLRELLVHFINNTYPIKPIIFTTMGITEEEFEAPHGLKRTGSD